MSDPEIPFANPARAISGSAIIVAHCAIPIANSAIGLENLHKSIFTLQNARYLFSPPPVDRRRHEIRFLSESFIVALSPVRSGSGMPSVLISLCIAVILMHFIKLIFETQAQRERALRKLQEKEEQKKEVDN